MRDIIGDRKQESRMPKPRWSDAFRMALPPAAIALAVTLLRLAGELRGWSEAWFSRETGGLVPTGALSWLVGITWLALPFGAWLALRLVRSDERPASTGRAVLIALVSPVALYGGARLVSRLQLVFWGAFTIVAGMLGGTLVAALGRTGGRV
jgi:hypothetical protein